MHFQRLNDGRIQFGGPVTVSELSEALEMVLAEKLHGEAMTDPVSTGKYLQARIGHLEHEVFVVVWLSTRHRVIAVRELFRGTIDCSAVYPREVVKDALQWNASAAIFAHNHPSQDSEPSTADRAITLKLREALSLIDVRVLDHFVIGAQVVSMASRGLI